MSQINHNKNSNHWLLLQNKSLVAALVWSYILYFYLYFWILPPHLFVTWGSFHVRLFLIFNILVKPINSPLNKQLGNLTSTALIIAISSSLFWAFREMPCGNYWRETPAANSCLLTAWQKLQESTPTSVCIHFNIRVRSIGNIQ